jgi:hypothetical protein
MVPRPGQYLKVGRAHVDFGIIRQCSESLIQRSIHFLRRAFEEPSTPAVEECVTRENDFFLAILHEPADAVLCVAWGV